MLKWTIEFDILPHLRNLPSLFNGDKREQENATPHSNNKVYLSRTLHIRPNFSSAARAWSWSASWRNLTTLHFLVVDEPMLAILRPPECLNPLERYTRCDQVEEVFEGGASSSDTMVSPSSGYTYTFTGEIGVSMW